MRVHEYFPQGIRLYTDVDDLIPTMEWQSKSLLDQEWEPETFAILNSCLDPETVLLDIGAWIGVLTVFGASRAKRVVAYEPDPNAFKVLTANVELNVCRNVICAQTAISDREGQALLAGSPIDGRLGCSTSQVRPLAGGASNCLEVPSLCLDNAVDQLRLAANERLFIKMDIEGGEGLAIPAAQDVWKRRPLPTLLLSLHGKLLPRPEITTRLLDHLAAYYRSDMVRVVAWDRDARKPRLLPLTSPIADSMASLLFAPASDLQRAARGL